MTPGASRAHELHSTRGFSRRDGDVLARREKLRVRSRDWPSSTSDGWRYYLLSSWEFSSPTGASNKVRRYTYSRETAKFEEIIITEKRKEMKRKQRYGAEERAACSSLSRTSVTFLPLGHLREACRCRPSTSHTASTLQERSEPRYSNGRSNVFSREVFGAAEGPKSEPSSWHNSQAEPEPSSITSP